MQAAAPQAPGEPQRLHVLYQMGILDTPEEERFDRLARLACQVLDAPMGLVSFVDEQRMWAKSGVGTDIREIPREISFCTHAIQDDGPFVVEDARQDARFEENPLVTGGPGIRFYAGTPLEVQGQNIGTLCIFDSEPRRLTASEERLLIELGQIARDEVEDVAARAAEERLRTIIAATPDAMVTADHTGCITGVNPAAERLLGYEGGETLGRPLSILMPERYRAAHEAGFAHYLSTGEAHVIGTRVELHALHKDGHEIPVELSLAASASPDGLAFTGILRDITRRRELEEERLQRRAKEIELQKAQEFDRFKNRFINQASHELFTPLTPIALHLDLLKSKAPEHNHDIEVMERNVHRLQAVIDQVMRVARLQSEAPLDRQAVDLEEIAADVLRTLRARIQEKDLTVDAELQGPLPVDGDPGMLQDAVLHVVDNAVRHTPEGGEITLRGTCHEDVRLWVQDDGPGIPEGDEERVFEAFYTGRSSQGGWGLGLFVALTIVHRHGGTIQAVPGQDGRVEMRFPRTDPPLRSAPTATP